MLVGIVDSLRVVYVSRGWGIGFDVNQDANRNSKRGADHGDRLEESADHCDQCRPRLFPPGQPMMLTSSFLMVQLHSNWTLWDRLSFRSSNPYLPRRVLFC